MKAHSIIKVLVQFAPHALLFAMIASFVLVGYFAAMELANFGFLVSVSVAAVLQVIRLAAGLSSSEFFRRKDYGKAVVVLCFSLALTIYEGMQAGDRGFLTVLVWSGLFLEIFLGLSLLEEPKGNE